MPFLEFSDAKLYFEVNGSDESITDKPSILLIQGIGVAGSGWKSQTEFLSKNFNVVTFDNRGFGKSTNSNPKKITIEQMAEDAKQIMQKLGVTKYHIAGHSMGGIIAQRIALDNPEKVKSLGLLCTVSKGSEATQVNWNILKLGLRTRIGTKAMRRKAFLDMIFSKSFLKNNTNYPQIALELSKIFGRDLADSPAILMKQMRALSKHDCSNELHKLKNIPTLIISATEDPIAPPKYGKKINDLIQGSKFIEYKNASHAVIIEDSKNLNPILFEFLMKT